MSIKNFWSLEPGEAMVAEVMQQKLHGWEVFFPIKDVGVDLVAASAIGTNEARLLTFQVKESKAFERRERDATPPNTVINWFVLDPAKAQRFQARVNFYIFVCSRYDFARSRKVLVADYVIVPSDELLRRLHSYRNPAEKRWHLYLCVKQEGRCLDWRGIGRKNRRGETKRPERDYTRFLNNWKLVSQ